MVLDTFPHTHPAHSNLPPNTKKKYLATVSPITEENPRPMGTWYDHRQSSSGKPILEQSAKKPALCFMSMCVIIFTIKQYQRDHSDKT